jgi:hypothetical protein
VGRHDHPGGDQVTAAVTRQVARPNRGRPGRVPIIAGVFVIGTAASPTQTAARRAGIGYGLAIATIGVLSPLSYLLVCWCSWRWGSLRSAWSHRFASSPS